MDGLKRTLRNLILVVFFIVSSWFDSDVFANRGETNYKDWEEVAEKRFSQEDIERLRNNHTLVTNETFKQVFVPYLNLKGGDIPLFITSDSLINAYHVLYEESILRLEKANADKLPVILKHILKNLDKSDDEIKGDKKLLIEAHETAKIIIGTAMRLINDDFRTGNKKIDNIVGTEVAKIVEAKAKEMPRWLGRPSTDFIGLDYNRYKVRGFYTRSEILKRYFRAVSWLQSIPFRVENDKELLTILLIANAYNIGICEDRDSFNSYFNAYRMFIGSGDDWDLIIAAEQIKSGLIIDLNKDGLKVIRRKLDELLQKTGGPEINDQLRFPPTDPNLNAEPNFRIISAYRTPDGILFHRTTDLRKFNRSRPDGLELCIAMGSSFAQKKLTDKEKEKLLKTINEIKSVFNGNSLYFEYLDCLRELINEPSDTSPEFMKKEAWSAKSCNTVLAGWSQLRHTWALQAKQTVHYLGLTMVPSGFVEPEPEFFKKMAKLAKNTSKVLRDAGAYTPDYAKIAEDIEYAVLFLKKFDSREEMGKEFVKLSQKEISKLELAGLLIAYFEQEEGRDFDEDFKRVIPKVEKIINVLKQNKLPDDPNLQDVFLQYSYDIESLWMNLEHVCIRLAEIAEKELVEKDLSSEDEAFIKSYGIMIAGIMLYGGNSYLTPNDDAPKIVDVYSNPYKNFYMNVGIARPRALYVLYPWDGKKVLCKGAVLPYYEFTHKERLTDNEWRRLLDSEGRPKPPEWINFIICKKGFSKPELTKY